MTDVGDLVLGVGVRVRFCARLFKWMSGVGDLVS